MSVFNIYIYKSMKVISFLVSNLQLFDFRDETKQEEMWKRSMEYVKEHLSEEEIYCLEGADPSWNTTQHL